MTYPLTPRQDRLRVLRARRDQLDALIKRLEDAERELDPKCYPDCGSERAYKRHRRHGERACLDCLRAHASYVAEQQAKPRRRPRHIKPACGTEEGYQYHRARDEERCAACKAAHSRHNSARRAVAS